MNFTPKIKARPFACGMLAIAAAGLIGWVGHLIPSPAPIVGTQAVFAERSSLQTIDHLQNVPVEELARARGLEMIRHQYYQPISWYKNKGWWRRNAPIIGGAGGGALIGGLAGGGKGALIGGAAGGGGGYLYKRLKQRHDQRHHSVNHRSR
jgi:hypothetical protein